MTAKQYVKSLVIDGNLTMEYVNGIFIPDVIPLLNRSFDSEFGDFTFQNLKAGFVRFLNTVNDVDINFIMNDTVRLNTSQVRFNYI